MKRCFWVPRGLLFRFFCVFFTASVSCASETHRIFVRRTLPLPGKVSQAKVEETRWLLGTDGGTEQALRGNWAQARGIWEAQKSDCRRLNNIGLSLIWTGGSRNDVVRTLSQAFALCPENEEIRWNYRAELTADPVEPPVVRTLE